MLLATTSLNCKQRDYCPVAGLAFVIACLLGAAAPAFAQESAKGSTEKWRPKDGLYAEPGADFNDRCMNSTEFSIELSEKSISGNEWSCAINKMVNTASGAIQLNMTCNDLNLAAHIKASDDKEFKEVMLLKRINEQSISVRKTLNGKFEGPNWQADYCPEDVQRMHIEEKIKHEEEAKYKVPEQLLNPKQWRPRDGIYASPGADFNDRCTKSGDVVVGLTEGSISIGKTQCKVVGLMSTGQAAVSLTCSPGSGKQAPSSKKKGGDANARKDPETLSTDVIRMSRIDDNTFHMQKSVDRKFKDDGGPVAYCPEEAQRAYAASKEKK